MLENPLVSVLVPCYNAGKRLCRCLDSVVKQTYENVEIVILDDGSADNTLEIIKEYAVNNPKIKFFHRENGGGVSQARNFLLEHKNGEYFCWVDSDDCIEPNFVAELYQGFQKSNADMTVCGFRYQFFLFSYNQ